MLRTKSSSDINYNQVWAIQTNQGKIINQAILFEDKIKTFMMIYNMKIISLMIREFRQKDPFENVETQYGITDDDLPF